MDGIPKVAATKQFGCEGTAGKKHRCSNGEEERADIHVENQPAPEGSLLGRFQFNRLLELVDRQVIP